MPYGGSYAVTVTTQPTGQTCSIVTGGSGSNVQANVTNLAVSCTAITYTVGGPLSGLSTGSVQLQLAVTSGATTTTESKSFTTNGPISFTKSVPYGGSYAVTVTTQPTGQTCSIVTGGSGSNVQANVTNLAVSCTAITYTVGGSLSGLSTGSVQLQLAVTSGATTTTESKSFTTNGPISFTQSVPYGGSYAVTVTTQPTGQTCSIVTGAGSNVQANVTNLAVSCTAITYTVGGPLSGLNTGSVQLQLAVTSGATTTTERQVVHDQRTDQLHPERALRQQLCRDGDHATDWADLQHCDRRFGQQRAGERDQPCGELHDHHLHGWWRLAVGPGQQSECDAATAGEG